MERILFFLFIVIVYNEMYLLFAPVQDWSLPKYYAKRALSVAPPALSKNMSALEQCIETANVKYIGYVNRNTTAYVTLFRPWANRDVYVTVVADSLSVEEKANTLIHECTHLVWCTVDLAYYGDSAYWSLTPDEESRNADSFTEMFSPYVYQAVQEERSGWHQRISPEAPTKPTTIPELDSPLLRRKIV